MFSGCFELQSSSTVSVCPRQEWLFVWFVAFFFSFSFQLGVFGFSYPTVTMAELHSRVRVACFGEINPIFLVSIFTAQSDDVCIADIPLTSSYSLLIIGIVNTPDFILYLIICILTGHSKITKTVRTNCAVRKWLASV